jgi:hypothetical protein
VRYEGIEESEGESREERKMKKEGGEEEEVAPTG